MKKDKPNYKKLKIWSYKDPQFTTLADKDPMVVSINPERYARQYRPLTYDPNGETILANGERVDGKIVDPPPETFKLELWFDGTGAIPGARDVNADIGRLKRMALEYNGDIHSVNYIMLDWGGRQGLLFKGQLQSLSIDYQLFDDNGKPLRAKADATFVQFIDARTRESLKRKSSPDLTHVRVVQDGDTLPLMCFRIYGDPALYLQVARANGLPAVTHLRPGQRLIFPPLE